MKNYHLKDKEVAEWLRMLAVLTEDSGSITITYTDHSHF